MPEMMRRTTALLLCFCALLAACAAAPRADPFAACPAYAPAYEVTDRFMESFNARDIASHEATLHFPHVRIASGRVTTVPEPGGAWMAQAFERLLEQGWRRSAWAERRIVQCGPAKAHMLTTFVRYREDGSELSRFDSLYIIEFKEGRWAITARSSFAE